MKTPEKIIDQLIGKYSDSEISELTRLLDNFDWTKNKTVPVELLRAIKKIRIGFNEIDLHEVEFTENGVPIDIFESAINYFELTGFNNIDFITSGYYRKQ